MVMRKRLSWPMFSTSGELFMIVFTRASGSSTSLDLGQVTKVENK